MTLVVSSEESRKVYADRKSQVLELLDTARNYYLQEENSENAEIFTKLYNDLENGEFSIVIVGEFSAGKSTLLNALMGNRILPSFSNETTATVNFLRHSDKSVNGESGKVFYNDGNQDTIVDTSLETIMKYVSTKGDDVAKKVKHLDLYLDSDFLKDGVTLVDSPGLNGVADGHREITEAQILKSHACIFLFNSDHPGSKTDFEFLYDLQSKVKTIIFVLNKIDEIKADEGETPESVIKTLKRTYKDKFPEVDSVPEIWPVAAYPALVARNAEPLEYHGKVNRTDEEKKKLEKSSRLNDFENRLLSFLTCGEKAKQELLSPVERIITLTVNTRDEYEKEKDILENSVDTADIDNEIAGIKDSMEKLEKQILDSRNNVAAKIRDSLKGILEEFAAQMSRLEERKLSEINEFNDLNELMDYLHNFERSFIQKVHRIAVAQEENLKDKIISVVKLQYMSQAEIIESHIMDNVVEINLAVDDHLDSRLDIFEVGLKEMNEKVKNLEEQLKILNKEAVDAENDYNRAKKIKRKREALQVDIKNLKEERRTVESQNLPPVERYSKEVHKKERRGGILGVITWVLVGGRNVTYNEQVIDRTEHDLVKAKLNKQSAELSKEISDKQGELQKIEDVKLEDIEAKHNMKLSEVEAMRNELAKLLQDNTEKTNEKYNKRIKRIKRKLTDYCDEITMELNQQVKKVLRSSEQAYVDMVLNIVEASLKKALKDKKNRLEQLEKQLDASEAMKNARIKTLEEKIQTIEVIIGNASDLHTDLKNIPVDQIQQEKI